LDVSSIRPELKGDCCVLGLGKSGAAMVNSEYYRRQADLCLQLALTQADPAIALQLIDLAEEYQSRAGEPGVQRSWLAPPDDDRHPEPPSGSPQSILTRA
jgi:hypothetical protein